MYAFDSRIRYSETDSEGYLTLDALLNYFQDCSTFHSEDVGLGIGYMKEIGQVWVLSSWQIVVNRYPKLGEKVKIVTLPYELKVFLGYRNFAMLDEQGEYLAKANSLWSLLDVGTGKPVMVNEAMHKGYEIDEKLDMEYAPRKIAVPEGGELLEPIVVKKHHLDTNHHVNNGQYVNIAMEYLPDDFVIRQMRAEYKKQAFLDDVLHPYVVSIENGYVICLQDEARETLCISGISGTVILCCQNRRERGIEIRRKTDAGNSEKSRIRSVSGNEGSTGGQSAAAGEAGAGRSKGRR